MIVKATKTMTIRITMTVSGNSDYNGDDHDGAGRQDDYDDAFVLLGEDGLPCDGWRGAGPSSACSRHNPCFLLKMANTMDKT